MTFLPKSNVIARSGHSRHLANKASWRVIHACEYAHDILPVVEGQVAAGIRPYIVTPQGAGTAELYLARRDQEERIALSLLRAWQDVRNWRKSLLDCDPETSADLVHTHSFASGMAGVRNLPCVVYDVNACIEELAISAGQCERGSWMGRSFRVAEQFILSRAQAVVVHSLGMKAALEERGALPESVFLIPEPLVAHGTEVPLMESDFLRQSFGIGPETITYFVPTESTGLAPSVLMAMQAFAVAAPEVPESQLVIAAASGNWPALRGHAEALGVPERVFLIAPEEALEAMWNATVVIAADDPPDDPVQARLPNQVFLQALAMGKAVLAADVARNRDGSPEGIGCLWFKPDDARDQGGRMVLLGKNPGFRADLAASGRAYILHVRDITTVGKQYDDAYRYALSRKKPSGPGQQIRLYSQQFVLT